MCSLGIAADAVQAQAYYRYIGQVGQMEAHGKGLFPSVKPLGKGTLRNSGDNESVVRQRFVAVEAFAEHGYYRMSEHPACLGGYARHCHQDVAVSLPHHYGRCSVDVLYDGTSVGYEGLIFGQSIELTAFCGKYAMNVCCDFRVVPQASAKDFHQRGLGDIVLGRSEASGGDYDVGGSHGAVYCRSDVCGDVAYDLHLYDRYAKGVETAGDVARIGIGDASQQDFVAYDNDVCFH